MEVAPAGVRAQRTIDDVEMSPFLRKVVLFSSGGSFLDGYALSIIGVALVQLGPALGLTATDQAMIGAASLAGIFVGSILAGRLTDGLGRRTMFILDVTAIGVTSLASVFVASPWQLIVLRLGHDIAVVGIEARADAADLGVELMIERRLA